MKEGGKIITTEFDAKPAVRKNAETATDWIFHEEAERMYTTALLFKTRFLDPIARTDRGVMPDPVISFDNLRNKNTLAAYTLNRNPQGLLDEITLNTVHYEERDRKVYWKYGDWAKYETLLHEQIHLWQQNFGEHSVKPGRSTHNKEFVVKATSLGLHVRPNIGSHYSVADADSPFGLLMKELLIERPDDVPRDEEIKTDWFLPPKTRGKSTLKKWICPDCSLNVRIGINDDPELIHEPCGSKLIRGGHGNVYEKKKEK